MTSISTAESASAGGAARRRAVLIVLCLVQFMLNLDDNVVSVALPTVRDDLGFSTAGLAWVVNGYILAFGGFLLLFGRVADLLGRRRVFLSGVALFGVASVFCGLAQEPWQLVAGRFIQGSGAAMASPAALALLTLLYPGARERAKAIGVWGATAAVGATSGLVISGALTGFASWRWIFLINVPVVVAAMVLLPRLVAESRSERRTRIDISGAVLIAGAPVLLVYGLLRASETGWGGAGSTAAMIGAVLLAVAFVAVEKRTDEPLVPLSFLAFRPRAVANVATLLFSAAFYAMAFLLMLHIQTVLGYGPFTAGLAYLPFGAGILAGMWVSSRAVGRFGARPAIVAGLLISAAGLLLMSGIDGHDSYVSGVLPALLVTSAGCGMSLPALAVTALTGTNGDNAGIGSAVLTSVQQVGGAVGLAILVTLATRRSDTLAESIGAEPAAVQAFSYALTVAAALVGLAAVLIATMLRSRPSTFAATPTEAPSTAP
ncbi:MFS transporter [Nocardia salmonicida]|uniref:EmrB/QacA subfamily drug resistance transporter n=1 Tax=Nocardia fluminea TaxID=134984 RepID=A0A2N3VHB3_9NOCA|nr:MFS transporter [Nocardia fluminea]PKV81010.1 EmrB/QacA subfamily drug resistance transporter [Nocardia fluminea]